MKKIIIDTDGGHDDILALYLSILSKKLDILGVTCVAGNSKLQNVERNCQYALTQLNCYDTPIFSGADKPLSKKLTTAVVHGQSGLEGAELSQVKLLNLQKASAVDFIIDTVNQYPHEVTILTLGPLTNIALALNKDPQLASKVNEIVIMGGAINVPGNQNRVAEYNFYVDPDAASIVLGSKVDKVLIPLDPCNEVIISESEFFRLPNTLFVKSIIDMIKPFIRNIKSHLDVNGALVYDAIAAYYLICSNQFKLSPMDILIETDGVLTRGMCVIEKRNEIDKIPNILVAVDVNVNSFKNDFFRMLAHY